MVYSAFTTRNSAIFNWEEVFFLVTVNKEIYQNFVDLKAKYNAYKKNRQFAEVPFVVEHQCAICLENIGHGVATSCNHFFHLLA